MIVVVAGEKGGSGKTTLAVNMALMRKIQGSDVLLVDSDPQRSASDFVAVRAEEKIEPELSCVSILGSDTKDHLKKLHEKFDDIVVDVGGRDSKTLRSALIVADVLVMPILPGQLDIWAAERVDDILDDVLEWNPNLRTIALLNKADTNPKIDLSDKSIEVLNQLKHIHLNTKLSVTYRVVYRKAVAEGKAIIERDRADTKAILEMNKLHNEVFKNETKTKAA